MKDFSSDEIETILNAMDTIDSTAVSAVELAPLSDAPTFRPLMHLTDKEWTTWKGLKVKIEVVFGSATLTLEELVALKPGSILPFDQNKNEPVDIYANGKKIGKGVIVTSGGHYGIQIVSFEKKA